MLKLISVLLFLNFGCATRDNPRPATMSPMKADIPELQFWYLKDSTYHLVRGHGGDFFKPGDIKKFKIKTNVNGGDCQIRYVDGDTDITKNCRGKSDIELDLGVYTADESDVAGISVSMERLGSQFGHFYPNLRQVRDPIKLEHKCPWMETKGSLSVCTRPATYKYNFSVNADKNMKGKLFFSHQCRGQTAKEELIDIQGPLVKKLSIAANDPTYCVIGLGLRWEDKTVQSHVIHVRFYDPLYVPMPQSDIQPVNQTDFKVCATERFGAMTIGGRDLGRLAAGQCKNYKASTPSWEAWAWDVVGRFSWVAYNGSSFLSQENGYKFYDEIEPWLNNKVKEICGNRPNRDCLEKNKKTILQDPSLVSAVENWDSSILWR